MSITAPAQRFTQAARPGWLLALVVLVVYLALAPAHVVDGDNAEMATLGALGGRAHPSGYPTYVLYLRATSWLPGSTPAHAAALATALLGATLVLVLHAACRAWGARPLAATLACALYAASPVVLRMHTEAEVFAMNGLVVALVLWLAAARGPVRGVTRAALLGLVAGLGMGNHLTCALIAPVGLLGVVRAVRESERRLVAGACAIGALGLGLSTYAYLLIADGPVSFGRVDGFGDVLDFFLRTDYGGPGAFVPTGETVSASTNLGALATTLGRGWLWIPALAGLGALGSRIARPAGESRWAWGLLAASFVLAGPLLVLKFNIPPEALGLYVVQRFHLLPLLLLAIPVASAFDVAGTWLGARVSHPRLVSPLVGASLGIAVFVAAMAPSLGRVRAVHSPAMERGVRNLLRSLPERAVLVVASEDLCFGAEYLQHATGERPDVTVACWTVTSRAWYRQRLAQQGVLIDGAYTPQLTRAQAAAIVATRPLFVERAMTDVAAQLPAHPHGTVLRILPEGTPVPRLHELFALNLTLYEGFDLDYPRPGVDDDYAAVAHRRYAATWRLLAAAAETAGDAAAAEDARALMTQLVPR